MNRSLKVIKYIFYILLGVITVLVGLLKYMKYEFSKDHDYIMESVSRENIVGFNLDYCYENKCFYDIRNDHCDLSFMVTRRNIELGVLEGLAGKYEEELCGVIRDKKRKK